MMRKKFIFFLISIAVLCTEAYSQERVVDVKYVDHSNGRDTIVEYRSNSLHYSVSTNLYDWANLGTMSFEGSFSLMRRWSFDAGVRYNPWSFLSDDNPKAFQNRRRTFYAGPRLWPWNVYSGWWFGANVQYEEYNRGGLWGDPHTEEGDAFGVSLGFGYTYMLHRNWNLEAGVFGWGGKCYYTEYAAPRCGKCVLETGTKPFLRLDRINVSIVYLFNRNNKSK